MTQDKKDKQNKLTQDYADFLVEYETGAAHGKFIGSFIEWQHATGRVSVKISKRGEKQPDIPTDLPPAA